MRGIAAGGQCRHRMHGGIEQRHAEQMIGQEAGQGEREVDRDDVADQFAGARRHPFRALGGFRLEQLHAAHAEKRQHDHRHDDDAHASDPLQQRAPDENARWQRFEPGHHRGAGRREP